MELQHPSPPEPPVVIPPNRDVPDPADPMRRNPDRHLPPGQTPVPEREPDKPKPEIVQRGNRPP
jgi:hypothetical protein